MLLALTSAVAVAVDEQLGDIELLAPACSLRGPTPGGVDFSTAPVQGTRTEGAASVVHLDAVAGERMCGDLQTDSLPRDAEKSSQALPEVPR